MKKPLLASMVVAIAMSVATPAHADHVLRFVVPVKIEKLFPEVKTVRIRCTLSRSDRQLVFDRGVDVTPVNGAVDRTFLFTMELSPLQKINAATWRCGFALYYGAPPAPNESAIFAGPGVADAAGRAKEGTPFRDNATGSL